MITPEEDRPAKLAAPRDFAPYLAEASEVLASSLDYQDTLASLARLTVPDLADWCAIDMVEENGAINRLAVAHEDPEKIAWARELRCQYPPDPDASQGVPRVLRGGEAEFYPEVTDEMLVVAAHDDGHLRLMREVGFMSVMIVPLIARGRTLGAMTLVTAESGRRYEPGDLALAEDLARRAALAVDNARLYREAQGEIAERKRAEQTLRRSRRKYKDLVDSLEGIVWEADAQTVEFSFVSEQAERLLGYPTNRWIAEPTFWQDHIHPDDREWAVAFCATATAEKRDHEFEYRMIAADGRTVWLRDIVIVILEDDEPVTLRGVMVDITERKRTEHDLMASEQRLSRIVETNADGIAIVGLDGRITFANAAAEKLFGLARGDITERTYNDPQWKLTTADGGLFPDEELPFAQVIRAGEPVYGVEFALEHPGGSRAILSVNGAPLCDAGGDITGMVASFSDITERKRAEEELRRRDAISEAVRFAAERFLRRTGTWEEGAQEVLERLGHATGVSRVYVFENYVGEDGETWATNTHEWVTPGVSAQIDNPLLRALPYRAAGFGRWMEAFGRGETLYGHVQDLPEDERPELEAEGTLSYVLVPIFVEGQWWGFIGFDECMAERDFSAAELDALKAAADTLGAAIGRDRAEEELKESQRALATLMSNLLGMAYRCRNDEDWTMEFVSEGCFELIGHAPDELVGNRQVSYGDLIYPDDRESVWKKVQAAIGERRPFQVTYRITSASGALKWVWEQGRGVFSPEGTLQALEGFVTDQTERVRAYRLLEERVAALARMSEVLTVDQPMEETLNGLAAGVVGASTAVACSVVLIDTETGMLRLAGSYGLPDGYTAGMEASWRAGAQSLTIEAFRSQQPLLVRDACRLLLDNPLYAPIHSYLEEVSWDTASIVPLVARGRALGAINVYYLPEREPSEDEMTFLGAIADQTAVAVENTRLFAAAQGKAALEERQRLARELHDSVSQVLYGIVLGTDAARTLLDREPDRAAEPLDYILSLARAGLTEMRALIFELRPESLESEGLIAALEKHAAALRARHDISVCATILCEEPDVPLEAKEVLYRIAQEALHNTVKHAHASSVELKLECGTDGITLDIGDDGVGFDPSGDFPGHLGLKSMRERAERLGGTLEVDSGVGKGTRVLARIPSR